MTWAAFPVPADSVLRQFMCKEQKGIVFFLSAGKKDVTFYLDGRIELLSILYYETRIIFCKGLISIDVRFNWLAIFDVSIHLKVNYQDFNRGMKFSPKLSFGSTRAEDSSI